MKKNLFYLSMLAIALITGSCSNDLDEVPAPAAGSSGQAITFKPWANKPLRAAATQAKDVTDFAVLATDTTLSTGVGVLINGALVTGSNATSWSYAPPAFWPEIATVNFFAFSPTAAVGVTNNAAALTGQNDATAGQPNIEYELPAALADQTDLLVARRSSTFAQDGASGVLLNFRHALSRVLFQAKSESGMEFIVSGIKLKNVKSKAKLDLNNVPKDATAFPYPTGNATIASPGYQVHWEPVGTSTVDLEAKITNTIVAGGGAWTDVVGDVDALYVIPQENDPSDLKNATLVTGPDPSSGFYIEITYRENGAGAVDRTYAVPVPAIVGDAYISSIAFEMERQYTFQFELFGKKPIEFKGVTVSPYSTVEQEEPLRLHWAGSNIYWDGTLEHLTFADSNDKTKEQYQGVYFKWGSLTGISSLNNYVQGSTIIYQKGVEADASAAPAWAAIPRVVTDPAGTVYDREANSKYLTEIAHDTVAGIGDICKYLTELGYAPKGKRWRMPTSKEFGDATDYANGTGAWTAPTPVNANGTDLFTGGKRLQKSNTPFFPATGSRLNSTGALVNVGTYGYVWSSSPASASGSFNLGFRSGATGPDNYFDRTYGFPVRCVAE